MKSRTEYKYQVCLKEINDKREEERLKINFEIVNHGDLFKLLDLIQG